MTMFERLEARVLFDGQLDTTWGTGGVLVNVPAAGLQRGLGGLLYGVVNTVRQVVDLFGG